MFDFLNAYKNSISFMSREEIIPKWKEVFGWIFSFKNNCKKIKGKTRYWNMENEAPGINVEI